MSRYRSLAQIHRRMQQGRINPEYSVMHTLDRARERYGVWLNRDDYEGMMQQILTGRARYLGPGDPSTSGLLYGVVARGVPLLVVYCLTRGYIVTCLEDRKGGLDEVDTERSAGADE